MRNYLKLLYFLVFIGAISINYLFQRQLYPKLDDKQLKLDDIIIVIKTSEKNYNTRVEGILQTWYKLAPSQIYAVSDGFSKQVNRRLDNKLIKTNCKDNHHLDALCCKFGNELSLFFNSRRQYKWFCHVDDDNYIHVPNLVKFLSKYNHQKQYYFGKVSTSNGKQARRVFADKLNLTNPVYFYFGTLGAGVCLSNATMHSIREYANQNEYINGCLKYRLPDDMFLGLLLDYILKVNFTNVPEFNHHLDPFVYKNMSQIHNQITLTFGVTRAKYDKECNCTRSYEVYPNISTKFNDDPFRIRSLHCELFPKADVCENRTQKLKRALLKQV